MNKTIQKVSTSFNQNGHVPSPAPPRQGAFLPGPGVTLTKYHH